MLDSQYIAPGVTQQLCISAISGSLDRLSAEKDPCVRYDCHYKLWVYLHSGRPRDSPKWQLQIDGELKKAFDRTNEKYLMNKPIGTKAEPEYD